MAEPRGPPRVGLTTTAERRLRFGPFPSVADAMRFAGYAVAGALVIPWLGALAWLPILALGFLLTVWQPGGIALDHRLVAWVAWWERALQPWEERMTPRSRSVRGATARVDPGYLVTVVKCAGRPIAFLPPQELHQRFEQYRSLLRTLDSGVVMVGVGLPVDARPWVPPKVEEEEREDLPARTGYAEMVGVLCRHRQRRRVYVLLWSPEADADALTRLEERTGAVTQQLEALGVTPTRLEGSALGASLTRFGWNEAVPVEGP